MFCPHSQEEIINETIAGHFGGDYDDGDAIAKCFRLHKKPAFSNSSGLKSGGDWILTL